MAASQSLALMSRELGVPLLSVPLEKSAQPPLSPWPLVTLGEKRSVTSASLASGRAWRKEFSLFHLPGLQLRAWRKVLSHSVSLVSGHALNSPSLCPVQGTPS